jgi:hypothetical protein
MNYEYIRDNPEQLDDPSWHEGLPDDIIADIAASLQHPDQLSYFQITPLRRPTLIRKFQQLQESGAVLLVALATGRPRRATSPLNASAASKFPMFTGRGVPKRKVDQLQLFLLRPCACRDAVEAGFCVIRPSLR